MNIYILISDDSHPCLRLYFSDKYSLNQIKELQIKIKIEKITIIIGVLLELCIKLPIL